MIQLEQRLVERYPHWFEGPKAVLAQGLARSIAKFGKLDDINAWLAANGHRTGFDFVEGVLDHFGT
ncbi:MAG: GNAT family N-acetyltransferase, partial [Silanimonas sp.]